VAAKSSPHASTYDYEHFEEVCSHYQNGGFTSLYSVLSAEIRKLRVTNHKIRSIEKSLALIGDEDEKTINRNILKELYAIPEKQISVIINGKIGEKPCGVKIKTIIAVCFALGCTWDFTESLFKYTSDHWHSSKENFAYMLLFDVFPNHERDIEAANRKLQEWKIDKQHYF